MTSGQSPESTHAPVQSGINWAAGVQTDCRDLRGRVSRNLRILLVAFAAWAVLLPLDTAVVATGSLVAEGQNSVIQHRTGGVIRKIHVREGERVRPGLLVAELDPVINQAELTRLRARRDMLSALKARLEAENRFAETAGRNSARGLRLSSAGSGSGGILRGGAAETALYQEQEREFTRGRLAMLSEIEALELRAEGLREQQKGARSRSDQTRQQVALLDRQNTAARSLAAGGHLSRQQQWDIENRLLERRSELAGINSQNQALTNQIAEVQAQIQQARMRDARQTSEKLTEVLAELEQTVDQLRAAETEVGNTELRAAVAGTLVHTPITSIGAVLKAGETFAEIVPDSAGMDMQIRVAPKDISAVAVGQSAAVRISALNQRIHDKIAAKVVYVAADATTDTRTGEKYFEVRTRINPAERAKLGTVSLSPGMAGEAFIRGMPRTFAMYLLEPLFDSFSRAFGERP